MVKKRVQLRCNSYIVTAWHPAARPEGTTSPIPLKLPATGGHSTVDPGLKFWASRMNCRGVVALALDKRAGTEIKADRI